MPLLDLGTLPKVLSCKLVTVDVDHREFRRTSIADHDLGAAVEARGIGEADNVVPIINGEEWRFTDTVVAGWRLLRRTDDELPGSLRQCRYILMGGAVVHERYDLVAQVPQLILAHEMPLDSAGKEKGGPKHEDAMEALVAMMLLDYIIRRLSDD